MKNTYTEIPSEPVEVEAALTLVDVVAPSDLEAGYSFIAVYEGATFQVVVVSFSLLYPTSYFTH